MSQWPPLPGWIPSHHYFPQSCFWISYSLPQTISSTDVYRIFSIAWESLLEPQALPQTFWTRPAFLASFWCNLHDIRKCYLEYAGKILPCPLCSAVVGFGGLSLKLFFHQGIQCSKFKFCNYFFPICKQEGNLMDGLFQFFFFLTQFFFSKLDICCSLVG